MLLYIIGGLVCFCIINFRGQPEKMFLSSSLLIGILYIIAFPPHIRITWDEEIHYVRAIESSFARTVSIGNSVKMFSNTLPILYLDINLYDKEVRANHISEINSEHNNSVVHRYPRKYSNVYNYIGYIPAGLMIFIGRSLAIPTDITFIFGRLGIHIVYTILIYFAIRRLTSGKYIMVVIAMFPTVFFQSVTYNCDYWVIAFLMLGYAYFFHEIQNPKNLIEKKNLLIMVSSFVLGLGPKAIYFPLMFVLYFLNEKKFKTKIEYKKYIVTITILLFIVVASFMIPFIINKGGTGDLRGGSDISPVGQVKFILNKPFTYANILLNHLKGYLNIFTTHNYTTSFAYLGDTSFYYLIWILLGFVILTDKNKADIFSSNIQFKIIMSLLLFVTSTLIITALYIDFNAVGTYNIHGVQGRYLLPMLFPFLFVLGSSKIENNMNKSFYSVIVFGIMSFVLLNGIWKLCISKYI